MRAQLRRIPLSRAGEVWLHIDRFDKRGRAVWAVQYVNGKGVSKWLTAERVVGHNLAIDTAAFFGKNPRQPRAIVRLPSARVTGRIAGMVFIHRIKRPGD